MTNINLAHFEQVELRVGTVLKVEDFPEARKPAYKIWVDFGPFGIKKTSAQVTHHYTKEKLVGEQVMGIINFAPRQVANFMSEFLLTGFADDNGEIILAVPQQKVPNGQKLI